MLNKSPFNLAEKILHSTDAISRVEDIRLEGKLTRMVGLTLEAVGCKTAIGSRCLVETSGNKFIEAEVVGFSGDRFFLMSSDEMHGLMPGARIIPLSRVTEVPVSDTLLGRILDGHGNPLDGKGVVKPDAYYPLMGRTINPLSRECIRIPLDVGVRSLNALYTIGQGQRVGLFAGSGVGKSVLMGMMTCFTRADVIVVGLVGERGREVKEFIECNLGESGLKRSVVIAAPADTSPLMRLHGAMWATTVAEYFRDQGAHVLLLIDSLTRFAQAQRELGLAIGEPPASKGYPPSVFSKMSQLVERAGNADIGGGSITAFYTVLAEGDDQNDIIADTARSFLDGHIVLSRRMADAGIYPAVDIEQSISRVMQSIAQPEQLEAAKLFKRYYSKYMQNRDLISIGAYSPGADLELDEAIRLLPSLHEFLEQNLQLKVDFDTSYQQLLTLFKASGPR